jgi:hypothetical protein
MVQTETAADAARSHDSWGKGGDGESVWCPQRYSLVAAAAVKYARAADQQSPDLPVLVYQGMNCKFWQESGVLRHCFLTKKITCGPLQTYNSFPCTRVQTRGRRSGTGFAGACDSGVLRFTHTFWAVPAWLGSLWESAKPNASQPALVAG